MQVPSGLKPAIMGAVVGAIATMVLGFTQGGWYLGSSAERMAKEQSAEAVIAALVPVCVSQSRADPEVTAKLSQLSGMTSSYERRDFVMKAGWATMPAAQAPDSGLATACAEVLSKAQS